MRSEQQQHSHRGRGSGGTGGTVTSRAAAQTGLQRTLRCSAGIPRVLTSLHWTLHPSMLCGVHFLWIFYFILLYVRFGYVSFYFFVFLGTVCSIFLCYDEYFFRVIFFNFEYITWFFLYFIHLFLTVNSFFQLKWEDYCLSIQIRMHIHVYKSVHIICIYVRIYACVYNGIIV